MSSSSPDQQETVIADVEARHRREIKSLEGAHRAAIKKLKSTKGKKSKEAVSA